MQYMQGRRLPLRFRYGVEYFRGIMHSGYVKVWHKIQKSSIYKKPLICHLAMHLILEANHAPKKFIWNKQEIIVERGQVITGRKTLSLQTGLSQRNVRTAIETLTNIGFSTSKATSKFSIITICNYNKFQDNFIVSDQQSDQQATSKRPASDQQATTNKNDNNYKNEKNKDSLPILEKPKREVKNLYGEYKNIKLTETEVTKLREKLNSHTDDWIEKLSQGIEMKGYKYKNHYLAILNWYNKDCKDKPIWERED